METIDFHPKKKPAANSSVAARRGVCQFDHKTANEYAVKQTAISL